MLKSSSLTVRMLLLALCASIVLNGGVVGAQDPVTTQEPALLVTPEAVPTDVPLPPEIVTVIATEAVTPAATETVIPPVVETIATTVTVPPVIPSEAAGTTLPPEPLLQLLVRETFDNGDLSPWLMGDGWALVPYANGLALQVDNSIVPAELLKGDFFNVAVQASFVLQTGAAQISVRQSETGNYTATLDASGLVRLFRSSELVLAVQCTVQCTVDAAGEANTLRLSAVDGVVRVAVNDVEVIAVRDEMPLPPGKVQVGADFTLSADGSVVPGNVMLINDFFLWVKADETALYPAPTAMSVPTQPTVGPTEGIIVLNPLPEIVVTSEVTPDVVVTSEPTPEVIVTSEPTPAPVEADPATDTAVSFEGKDLAAFPAPSAEEIVRAGLVSNDNFGAASIVPSANPLIAYASSGETTSATLETGEAISSCDYNTSHTIWFAFTPTVTANYTVSTVGSAFDTVLALYTGPAVNNLTLVACNDDATTTTFTSLLTRSLQAGTTYRIQLGGFKGRYGQYALSVIQMGLPVPTLKPGLTGPNDNALTNNIAVPLPALTWTGVANAHHYEVQIDDNALFNSLNQQNSQIVGTSYPVNPALPMVLTTPTIYYWRVRGLNISNQPGPWSLTRRFIVDSAPSAVPTPLLPASNGLLTTLRPTYSWKMPLASGAVAYRLDVDTAAADGTCDFQNLIINDQNVTTVSTVSPVLPQGHYCWQVRSVDAAGNVSASSAARSFKIFIGTLPLDNARQLTVGTATTLNVTFRWIGVSGATGYAITLFDETCTTPKTGYPISVGAVLVKALSISHGKYCWNVRAEGVENATPTSFRKLIIGAPAPAAPLLLDPKLSQSVGDNTPSFLWNVTSSPLGAPFTYDLQVDNSGCLFPSAEIKKTGLGVGYTAETTLNDGTYCWRVRTVNAYGVAGLWSPVRAFTVDTSLPQAPTMALPAANALVPQLRPTFSWVAAVGSASVSYRLDVDDDPDLDGTCDFNPSLINDLPFTKAPFTIPPSTTALSQGAYCWRVQALDAAANVGPESSPRAFKVFIGTSPADKTVYTPLGAATSINVAFKWVAVPGATGYTLALYDATCTTLESSTPVPVMALPTKALPISRGTHCWKVQALGIETTMPATFARVIVSPAGPAAPILTDPTIKQIIGDNTPEFKWVATTSTANGPFTYAIQVDNSGCLFPSPEINVPVSGVSHIPTTALTDGVYCWRVRSVNMYGGPGGWSIVRPFTLDTAVPQPPTLSAPVDKALLTVLRPSFNWVMAAGSGSAGYRLDVANDPDLDGVCDFGSGLAVENRIVTKVPYIPLAPTSPLPQGGYCWRVQAADLAANMGDESAIRSFKIFIGTAPLDHAIVYTTVASTTLNVSFKWAVVPGATGYILKLFDETCTTEKMSFDGAATPADRGASLVKILSVPHGQYCWKVQALGMDTTMPTTFRKLTVSPPPALGPVLGRPDSNAVTGSTTPEFNWNAVTGAANITFTYDLKVDNNGCTLLTPEIDETDLELTYTPTTPLADGVYCWKVRAVNNFGVAGAWSLPRSLTVDTSSTAAPKLIAPLDNVSVSVPQPAFSWGRVPAAVSYQIQLKTVDTACDAIDVPLISVPAPGGLIPPSSVRFVPASPLLNRTYYWCVRALDSVGNASQWSTRQAVKIVSAATAVSILNRFTTSPVKVTWGPISWAGYYEIQVDNHNTFLSPEYESENVPAGTQTLDVPVDFPLTSGTWYWRVRACPATGTCGLWSTAGVFTIEQ